MFAIRRIRPMKVRPGRILTVPLVQLRPITYHVCDAFAVKLLIAIVFPAGSVRKAIDGGSPNVECLRNTSQEFAAGKDQS